MVPYGALRRVGRCLASAAAIILVAGCAGVVRSSPDEIGVNTEPLGDIMPGTRHWLAWPKAREHCAAQGKSPQLHDLQGPVAIYRCVAE